MLKTEPEVRDFNESFRAAMARVCTPVAVVTTVEDGRPHGTTVSAFTSLSLNPPMILVSLDASSDLLALIRRTRCFGVNVLTRTQADLAHRFAIKGRDKFAGVSWVAAQGSARLAANAAWVACEVVQFVPGGDHLIVLGKVLSVEATEAEPLTYHARAFGTHMSMPPDLR